MVLLGPHGGDLLENQLADGPATVMQVGALHREFERLGFNADEREERFELAAELPVLDGLGFVP